MTSTSSLVIRFIDFDFLEICDNVIQPSLITAKVDYTLNLTLQIACFNDGHGPEYEPFGWLAIDVGGQTENQNVTLWEIKSHDYLKIRNGWSVFVHILHTFKESKDFLSPENGGSGDDPLLLTLHGEILEWDGPDYTDLIGRYESHNFTASELRNGVTHLFPGKCPDDAFARVSAKIVKSPL